MTVGGRCAAALLLGLGLSAATPSLLADDGALTLYRSFNREFATTADFAKMGIELRCFFAANTVNSFGKPYCEYPMIWKGIGKYDWSAFDAQIDDLVKVSPTAKFLVMIDLNTPDWLVRKLFYDSYDEISRAASDPEWRRITDEWLRAVLTHAETKYGERILGYILSGGGTSEWYEYDRGLQSNVKTEAWRTWCAARKLDYGPVPPSDWALKHPAFDGLVYDPATQAVEVDWWRFHNDVVADALCGFARSARSVLPRTKQLGAFFGYFYVRNTKITTFGHLAYERVYASPDLDFFIAPGNYEDRAIGGGGGTQLVPGTVAANGKRFLHEIDFPPNAYGWKTSQDRIAGNTREAAFALVNHAHSWWFDMWGHFYDDPLLKARIGELKKVQDRLAADRSPSAAEVLLVADPQSMCFIDDKSPKGNLFGQDFRNNLGRTGLPFDVYSFNDLEKLDLGRYKVIFLPAMLFVDAVRERILRGRVMTGGRTVAFEYAPGATDGKTLDAARVKRFAGVAFGTPGVSVTESANCRIAYAPDLATWTTDAMRRVCRDAGVHEYVAPPAVVYANERVLAIHVAGAKGHDGGDAVATQGGHDGGDAAFGYLRSVATQTVRLPRKAKRVVDLLTGETLAEDANSFTADFATPDTRLFETEY